MPTLLTNIPEDYLRANSEKLTTLASVGGNSGNCVFWNAARDLCSAHNIRLESINEPPARFANVRGILLVLANSIQNNTGAVNYVECLNNRIAELRLPYWILSIGAQCNDLDGHGYTLDDRARAVVGTLLDGAQQTFVRGHVTLRILQQNQIDTRRVLPVGCP